MLKNVGGAASDLPVQERHWHVTVDMKGSLYRLALPGPELTLTASGASFAQLMFAVNTPLEVVFRKLPHLRLDLIR